MLVLRLLVGASIIIKQEASLDWEWSAAFWPYWCSFIIQAVLIIATIVVFVNTLTSFGKGEAKMHDILGSLWGFLMAAGFMLSTLQPVIVIIKIFDVGHTIPEKFFDEEFIEQTDLYERELESLTA